MRNTFGLLGDGSCAQRHKSVIASVGGKISWIYDPKSDPLREPHLPDYFSYTDYVVIASPNYLHRSQTKWALQRGSKVIVEKPAVLPWEPLIDDDRVNICLPFRFLEDLPESEVDVVRVIFVRPEGLSGWRDSVRESGGILAEFFIHYIDLAQRCFARADCSIRSEGKEERALLDAAGEVVYDLASVDMNSLYFRMYAEILEGRGVRPSNVFLLHDALSHFH
jgi:predicted dehydrogenase